MTSLATEVLELLQGKASTAAFGHAYHHVQQHTAARRRERKNARLLQGINEPEKAAKRRASQNAAKHESRKRKNAAFRDRKGQHKPLKRSRP